MNITKDHVRDVHWKPARLALLKKYEGLLAPYYDMKHMFESTTCEDQKYLQRLFMTEYRYIQNHDKWMKMLRSRRHIDKMLNLPKGIVAPDVAPTDVPYVPEGPIYL